MLNFIPKYFTEKAILLYLGALLVISLVFFSRALPLMFMTFGFVEVIGFFYFSELSYYCNIFALRNEKTKYTNQTSGY